MNPKTTIEKVVEEVVKATPASTTLSLSLFGIPLTSWATILSCIVLLLQAYFMIRNNMGGKKE